MVHHRTTPAGRQDPRRAASRLGDQATVQYAKVAEYQLRGGAHFHALVRLDGPNTPGGFVPTTHRGRRAGFNRSPVPGSRLGAADRPWCGRPDPARVLAFGRQGRPAVRTARSTVPGPLVPHPCPRKGRPGHDLGGQARFTR
jgi:hypothetical protein